MLVRGRPASEMAIVAALLIAGSVRGEAAGMANASSHGNHAGEKERGDAVVVELATS